MQLDQATAIIYAISGPQCQVNVWAYDGVGTVMFFPRRIVTTQAELCDRGDMDAVGFAPPTGVTFNCQGSGSFNDVEIDIDCNEDDYGTLQLPTDRQRVQAVPGQSCEIKYEHKCPRCRRTVWLLGHPKRIHGNCSKNGLGDRLEVLLRLLGATSAAGMPC